MTYTTEEKRSIAVLRHNSKMAMLDEIAKAETIYNKATAAHKATLDKKVAEIETKAKTTLNAGITDALAELRSNETEETDNE